MADKIRSKLEKLIPDLLVLQRKQIFTDAEVLDIMRERERNELLNDIDINNNNKIFFFLDINYRERMFD
jgi:hypothetical protein